MDQQVRYYVKATRLAEAKNAIQQKNIIGAKAHLVSVAIYMGKLPTNREHHKRGALLTKGERKGLLENIVCGELLSSTDGQSRNNIEKSQSANSTRTAYA